MREAPLFLRVSDRYNDAGEEQIMITVRMTADVQDDRRIVLTLPPEVPTGPTELVVTIDSPIPTHKRPRTSLADWADANAENWGDQLRSDDVEGFTGRRY